jgi:hypothetical protein
MSGYRNPEFPDRVYVHLTTLMRLLIAKGIITEKEYDDTYDKAYEDAQERIDQDWEDERNSA